MSARPAVSPVRSVDPPLQVGGVQVEVRRSTRRRTVALRVGPDGAVLYAPSWVPGERLERFVQEREGWLLTQLGRFERRAVRVPLQHGSELPLLDERLTLVLEPGRRAATREGGLLHAGPERLHAQLEAWYREWALAYFTPLVGELAAELGRDATALHLTDAAGRWGSCTAAGVIRLHWRLLLAPARVARYVAAHEVAHLAELNHSPRYWAVLACLMPEYREPQRWLREHGDTLTLWE